MNDIHYKNSSNILVVTMLLLPKVYGYFIDKYKNVYRIR